MKKAIGLFLATTLAISSLSAMAFAEDKINVVVNGNAIDFTGNQAPVIQNDRVLVPFRAVFEEMGATVNWFEDIKLCEASYADATVGIKIGETKVTLGDGATVESDVPAQIINERTMVPLRILSESIGADVDWDSATKTVTIETPEIKETESPEKVDYEMLEAGEHNNDVLVSYSYPSVTTEYTFKDKLNKALEEDIKTAVDKFSDNYEGEEEQLTVDCTVVENGAGIFTVSYKIGDEEILKQSYGIVNGAVIDRDAIDIDIPEEDSTELASEETSEEVSEDSTEETSEETTEESSEETSEETTEETTEAE